MMFKRDVTNGIAVFGDWHGSASFGTKALDTMLDADVTTFVHVGDFGWWPNQDGIRYMWNDDYSDYSGRSLCWKKNVLFVDLLEDILEADGRDPILLWADGNHENFDSLETFEVDENGLQWVTPHIAHVTRGSRVLMGDTEWLFVGGAASVDRQSRVPHESWWQQEYITDEDVAKAVAGGPVEVVVAHDAPMDVPPLNMSLRGGWWPAEDIARGNAGRLKLQTVVDELQPKVWFHGHYHQKYSAMVDGLRVNGLDCEVDGLRANYEIDLSKNMMVVDEHGQIVMI